MPTAAGPDIIFRLLEKEQKNTSQNLNRLYEVLTRLRYEGKQHLGRNIRETRALLVFFRKEVQAHMQLEEKTLFPFIGAHIPRLEPIIFLLLSEHDDFRSSLEELRCDLAKIKGSTIYPSRTIDKVTDLGTYFICLCRNHMWAETQSLYKIAFKELQLAERRKLIYRIQEAVR